MKAIRTRYHGPTKTGPAKISARDHDGNRVVQSYDGGISSEANHYNMALRLRNKLNWKGNLIGGGYGSDTYWVSTR